MTDRYQGIREALAMGPTPGEWYWSDAYPTQDGRKTWSLIGDGGFGILSCDGDENSPQSVNAAAAELIAACDPDTIRELLAERDALAAENERLKEDRARFPSKPDDIGRMIDAHIKNLKAGKECAESAACKAFDRAFRAEAALEAAREDGTRLRETLRDVTGVAICGLFDTHREDTLREFSLQELTRVTEVTAPLLEKGVTVESVYRRGYDAAIDQARGEGVADEA